MSSALVLFMLLSSNINKIICITRNLHYFSLSNTKCIADAASSFCFRPVYMRVCVYADVPCVSAR